MASNGVDAMAGKARSGKWHLLDGEGCLNASQARYRRRAESVTADKRNREWCSYCRERLRQLQLQAEVTRLKAKVRASEGIDLLPSHLSLPEFVDLVADAETITELSQSARMDRQATKRVVGKLNLRQFVDGGENEKFWRDAESAVDGPNHGIVAGLNANPGSAWGQLDDREGDDGDE